MKRKLSMIRAALIIVSGSFAVTLVISPAHPADASMGSMGSMHGMMQRMMGDRLPPGIDPKLLPEPNSAGAHVLERYCTQCHNLPGPGMRTAQQWPAVAHLMVRRMHMMSGMMGTHAPNREELKTLIAYLQHHAQQPYPAAQRAALDTPAGRVFKRTCSQCHALPDPHQHTAAQWPGVVARMQGNMAVMKKVEPNAAQLQKILSFLRQHARS